MTGPKVTGQPAETTRREEDRRARWLRWLLLLLLLLLVTICCLWLVSQFALLGLGRPSVDESVDSALRATYAAWADARFNPVDPALIGTIRAEQLTALVAPSLGSEVPFFPLTGQPPLTAIADLATNTATPVLTNTPLPTRTPTPTRIILPPGPPRTRTPLPTATPLETATNTPAPPPPPPPTATPVPPITVNFTVISYTTDEGVGTMSILVTLSAPSPGGVSVNYTTLDGSALISDPDYTLSAGSIVFGVGATSGVITVPITDDANLEGSETFSVQLTGATGLTIGGNSTATVTINDNEGAACGASVVPGGEPDINAVRDLTTIDVACGMAIVVDLGAPLIIATGSTVATDWEIIYYENVSAPGIAADMVVIQIGATAGGPWFTVYSWGDGNTDFNTSIGQNGCGACVPPEVDDAVIPSAALVIGLDVDGIGIDVDPFAPIGSYRYIRIYSPVGATVDAFAEFDVIEIVP